MAVCLELLGEQVELVLDEVTYPATRELPQRAPPPRRAMTTMRSPKKTMQTLATTAACMQPPPPRRSCASA